ncbi:MAG: prephenate dehydratase [Bacteroidetes bacterium]|nr:prephenate dehydratase [Bacteroidota bacterium]
MESSRQKVLIQGFRGSYHEIAARSYFGDAIEVVPALTFDEIFRMLNVDGSLYGVVAIENTVSGSILPNYSLLNDSGVYISGEIKLRVSLNLLALPGQEPDDIAEVRSQALALSQCRDFFLKYPDIKLIESADTALSAKEISECGLRGAGVVGSSLAADLYGLEILAAGIESNKRNYTRFLVLDTASEPGSHDNAGMAGINKSSVVFRLPHRKGSLVEVLSLFSVGDCNLTTVQSAPLIGSEWEYLFYVDMTFEKYASYRKAVGKASSLCTEFKIIGEYREGDVFKG